MFACFTYKKQKELLKQFGKKECFYLALKEIARNLIKGNIKVSEKQRKLLNKHRKVIVNLACKENKKNRIKTVSQVGGFMGVALPLVLTLVTELIRSHGSRS